MAGPFHEIRHPDPPLVTLSLEATQRRVDRVVVAARLDERLVAAGASAIVRQEHDDRVVGKVMRAEPLPNLPDSFVHRRDHRGDRAADRILNVGEFLLPAPAGRDRRMGCTVGEVEQKRLGFVAIDEGQRLAGEGIGEILAFADHLAAPHHGRTAVFLEGHLRVGRRTLDIKVPRIVVGEVSPAAIQKPEELVEPLRERVVAIVDAEVPLADRSRPVARRLQPLGKRLLVERQPHQLRMLQLETLGDVVFVAEPLLVAAGEQAGPRGAADGAGDVAGRAPRTGPGHRIEVRRRSVLAAVAAEFTVAKIIGHDDDHVRRPVLLGGDCGQAGREGCQCAARAKQQTMDGRRHGK